ncbi:hypothetical protein FPZ24_14505 [Sphingomonas panacisoli]|uniref:Uncharacterized protein n=1 Tax=Sphingomonas panacisoli TaxID=1813879 RepID=A0A5B8LN80_9SPHN|nr:hypothetical protein [Sphingomonas panacisoli]QDZ08530.1 hypothetical protein FPZ24_14505 [Sphingomonas panacisoli]
MSGRPIRFLGIATMGWVAARAFMLWPTAGPAAIPRALAPAVLADSAPPTAIVAPAPAPIASVGVPQALAGYVALLPPAPNRANTPAASALNPVAVVPIGSPETAPVPAPPQTLLAPPSATAPAPASNASRWSASAWVVLRDGLGIAPGLGGGQLGGSQAGLRVAYAIGDARRVAIVGRVATPLKGSGREGALGVEWRPTPLPVRLVAEYRVALDSGASGPAAGIIAGTGPAPLAFGFDLETYGQAGVIRRRRTEPYAEGAARLSRRVVSIAGAKVDLGLGGWGGAQRGVQRLDVGPSLGVRIPIAGKAIRMSLDCGIM